MLKLPIVVALFTLAGAGQGLAQGTPAPAPMPSVTLPPELDRVLRDYEREWQGRSPAGLATLFVEDGFVLQSGKAPVRGRAAIAEAYRMAGGRLVLRALAFGTSETVGYIIGAFGYGPGSPDGGKFTLVLRREPGKPWLIVSDMDNANAR